MIYRDRIVRKNRKGELETVGLNLDLSNSEIDIIIAALEYMRLNDSGITYNILLNRFNKARLYEKSGYKNIKLK